jgi:hypothetical protein
MASRLKSGSPCATWIVATAQGRRPFHDNESGPLQMSHDPIGDDCSHVCIRVMDTLPAAKQQGESDRAGNVARVGGAELPIVEHDRTIADERERSKNKQTTRMVWNPTRGLKCTPAVHIGAQTVR